MALYFRDPVSRGAKKVALASVYQWTYADERWKPGPPECIDLQVLAPGGSVAETRVVCRSRADAETFARALSEAVARATGADVTVGTSAQLGESDIAPTKKSEHSSEASSRVRDLPAQGNAKSPLELFFRTLDGSGACTEPRQEEATTLDIPASESSVQTVAETDSLETHSAAAASEVSAPATPSVALASVPDPGDVGERAVSIVVPGKANEPAIASLNEGTLVLKAPSGDTMASIAASEIVQVQHGRGDDDDIAGGHVDLRFALRTTGALRDMRLRCAPGTDASRIAEEIRLQMDVAKTTMAGDKAVAAAESDVFLSPARVRTQSPEEAAARHIAYAAVEALVQARRSEAEAAEARSQAEAAVRCYEMDLNAEVRRREFAEARAELAAKELALQLAEAQLGDVVPTRRLRGVVWRLAAKAALSAHRLGLCEELFAQMRREIQEQRTWLVAVEGGASECNAQRAILHEGATSAVEAHDLAKQHGPSEQWKHLADRSRRMRAIEIVAETAREEGRAQAMAEVAALQGALEQSKGEVEELTQQLATAREELRLQEVSLKDTLGRAEGAEIRAHAAGLATSVIVFDGEVSDDTVLGEVPIAESDSVGWLLGKVRDELGISIEDSIEGKRCPLPGSWAVPPGSGTQARTAIGSALGVESGQATLIVRRMALGMTSASEANANTGDSSAISCASKVEATPAVASPPPALVSPSVPAVPLPPIPLD